MNKIYTGVGSRDTPPAILAFMRTIASQLAADGWTLRSGGADGADKAFEDGWWDWVQSRDVCSNTRQAELYIPWDGYNDHWSTSHNGCNFLDNDANRDEAEAIASSTHHAWDMCSPGARRLHTRNVYQVLGNDLDSPSDMLICWAKPLGRGVQGGTATSYAIAIKNKVRCFNLAVRDDYLALAAIHCIPVAASNHARPPNRLFSSDPT